jgi:arylsulfatase A-like enzyme
MVSAAEIPNIVYLMSDDQNIDSMGCYGNSDVKTPNIDRLADLGMTFDNHYVTTAICMASRASVMTGMYEYKPAATSSMAR